MIYNLFSSETFCQLKFNFSNNFQLSNSKMKKEKVDQVKIKKEIKEENVSINIENIKIKTMEGKKLLFLIK
jgi:hypothetical protein